MPVLFRFLGLVKILNEGRCWLYFTVVKYISLYSDLLYACISLKYFVIGYGVKYVSERVRGCLYTLILYSYFIPICSIVKTITPRCRGRLDALLHSAFGLVL